jgi:hypothetical protein
MQKSFHRADMAPRTLSRKLRIRLVSFASDEPGPWRDCRTKRYDVAYMFGPWC